MGMMDENVTNQRISGRVKWFDPVKGFGFVVTDDGGGDILLHANVLRNFGQSSVADGAGIDLTIQHTARGVQALEVHAVEPPVGAEPTGMEEIDEFAEFADSDLPFEPARVKWFDKSKGFGFANVFGSDEDIFVHVEVLRRSGFADLQPGEAIGLKVVEGKRGHMASSVTSWDSAAK
jgi:CspA family cold shock protein